MSCFRSRKHLQISYFSLRNSTLEMLIKPCVPFQRLLTSTVFIILKYLMTKCPSVRNCLDKLWFSSYDGKQMFKRM